MAIEIDKMFTVNEESIKHSLDILIDQRLNFRPISKEKLKELIKLDLSDIPFDGTILERNEFIEEKAGEFIDKAVEDGKIDIEEDPNEDIKPEPEPEPTPDPEPDNGDDNSSDPDNNEPVDPFI